MPVIFYYLVLIVELLFVFFIAIYLGSLLYSAIMGAPFVGTKNKEIFEILKKAKLKPGQKFLDVGCGDGRIVFNAVKNFGVKGWGIDINPLLIFLARLKARRKKVKATFQVKNIFDVNFSDFDVIYLFLMPEMLKKLGKNIKKTGKKNLLIISHGFRIENFDLYLEKTEKKEPFPTYFYRLN